jgi:oxazoline/thiazoline dehydrogenase
MNKNNNQVYIKLSEVKALDTYEQNYNVSPKYSGIDIASVFAKLKNGGIKVSLKSGAFQKGFNDKVTKELIHDMTGFRIIEFKDNLEKPKATLRSCSESFNISNKGKKESNFWQVSRFSYVHFENEEFVIRNSKAHCFIVIHDELVMKLFYDFKSPISRNEIEGKYKDIPSNIIDFFIEAEIISPCSDEKVSEESENDVLRQWAFHDLLFHSMSRTGRTEKDIGGSFRFKGVLPPQPPLKENVWKDNSIVLPKPNLQWLNFNDKPFTNVLESRSSIRNYGVLPLSLEQLGEFLYRSARVRYEYSSDYGEFISKPYPGGGANYETEFYITINTCAGVPRGVYYYDPKEHILSLVSEPNDEMEKLLYDAYMATALQGMPQILITLANRFNRFNWKYSSMSYAAQLKNIGAIYQTLYLVATSMGIGACGLGVGNTERFSRLTGLNYFEEGSVGEFMIGRPLLN